MTTETLSRKRYRFRVFVCISCNKLCDSQRAHAVTCSPACRTAVHRKPERFDELKKLCEQWRAQPALVLQARALDLLRPDLTRSVIDGKIDLDDTREDVHREFLKLVESTRAAREGHA